MTRDLKPGCFGVSIYPGPAMPKRCAECPFTAAERGEDYLAEGRLEGILFAVSLGQPFHCHKTVYAPQTRFLEHDEPLYGRHFRMCRGAIEAAEKLAAELGVDPWSLKKEMER